MKCIPLKILLTTVLLGIFSASHAESTDCRMEFERVNKKSNVPVLLQKNSIRETPAGRFKGGQLCWVIDVTCHPEGQPTKVRASFSWPREELMKIDYTQDKGCWVTCTGRCNVT